MESIVPSTVGWSLFGGAFDSVTQLRKDLPALAKSGAVGATTTIKPSKDGSGVVVCRCNRGGGNISDDADVTLGAKASIVGLLAAIRPREVSELRACTIASASSELTQRHATNSNSVLVFAVLSPLVVIVLLKA